MTTRRGAIIAALLGPAAAFGQSRGLVGIGGSDEVIPFLKIEIPTKYGAVALEVHYEDRVVKLSGDEIMDALEGTDIPICPGCSEANGTDGWAVVRHDPPLCKTSAEQKVER